MAFDHQLECDQIDFAVYSDSILFSIFLRIPLLILTAILNITANSAANNSTSSGTNSSSSSSSTLEQCFLSIVVSHHLKSTQSELATNNINTKWSLSLQTIDEEDSPEEDDDNEEEEESQRNTTNPAKRKNVSFIATLIQSSRWLNLSASQRVQFPLVA